MPDNFYTLYANQQHCHYKQHSILIQFGAEVCTIMSTEATNVLLQTCSFTNGA